MIQPACTIGGGLNAWNKQTNTFTHYRHNPSNGGKNSIGILSRLNRKTGTFKNHSFELPFENTYGNPVLTLYEDWQGFIWIGTTGGVSRFNPTTETWIHYPHDPNNPEGVSDFWTNTICEDTRGN